MHGIESEKDTARVETSGVDKDVRMQRYERLSLELGRIGSLVHILTHQDSDGEKPLGPVTSATEVFVFPKQDVSMFSDNSCYISHEGTKVFHCERSYACDTDIINGAVELRYENMDGKPAKMSIVDMDERSLLPEEAMKAIKKAFPFHNFDKPNIL